MNQSELAKLSGLTQVTISKIENGQGGTILAAIKIFSALDIELKLVEREKISEKDILDLIK
jgi:HTH-type transcriptional regulator/antitoxin HipB